jgi:hypothetical protein
MAPYSVGRVYRVLPVSSGSASLTEPLAGFHPPPRRTERADFPHSALLLASQEDLWDVANCKELVPGHVAKSDTYGPQRKAIHMAADSTTESDILLGVPTEHLAPAMNHDAGFDPSLRNRDSEWSGGANHQNLILTDGPLPASGAWEFGGQGNALCLARPRWRSRRESAARPRLEFARRKISLRVLIRGAS